jgi:hypothetical protein
MTTILKNPVTRISNGQVREAGQLRDIIVILRPPNVIGFRAKGCRKEYQLTTEACYTMAVRAHVQAERRDKQKQKRLKRKGQK